MGKCKDPEAIIKEFGSEETDEIFLVVRSFLLRTKAGPPEAVPVGAKVRLTPLTGKETFLAGQTQPVLLGEEFEAMQAFRDVGPDGLWVSVAQGDLIRLTRTEAVDYLRKRLVKEVR
jgi:hypothetical protein